MVGGNGGKLEFGSGSEVEKGERHRILVVEDEFHAAAEIAAILAEAGFEVIGVTASGEDAIEIAAREHPSLALIDIKLAGEIDGIDTAVAIYRDHGVRSIFTTAHYDKETQVRALPAFALGWLPKPFEAGSLVLKVRSALQPH